MDPASLIPFPDSIPVHWFWLQILLTVTTFLHLVAMNVLLGSGFIALFSPFPEKKPSSPLAMAIGHKIPFILAVTINLGVAPLLFLQVLYGQFFYTSTVLMAGYWLAIVGLLIITYYSAYIFHLRFKTLGNGRFLFIGLPVLLLLFISFLFTNNVSLMQMPESWLGYFENRNGWMLNFADQTIVPRYLHFIFSGIALGGLALAVYFEFRKQRGDDDADDYIKRGCNWFTVATVINFAIGFLFLASLPDTVVDTSTLIGISFTVMIYGSVAAGALSLIHAQRYRVFPAAVWTLVTVFLMVVARDLLRLSYLKPYFSLSELPFKSQYSPFILFLLFFGGVGFLIWWMLKNIWCVKEVK